MQSDFPDLRLNFSTSIEIECPKNWPDSLYWTPSWKELLEAQYPTVSFVYDDVLSSQVNDFEADAVAAMIWLLRRRLTNQLKNERQPDGGFRPKSQE